MKLTFEQLELIAHYYLKIDLIIIVVLTVLAQIAYKLDILGERSSHTHFEDDVGNEYEDDFNLNSLPIKKKRKIKENNSNPTMDELFPLTKDW